MCMWKRLEEPMPSHVVYQVLVGLIRVTWLLLGCLCRLPMPKDRIVEG